MKIRNIVVLCLFVMLVCVGCQNQSKEPSSKVKQSHSQIQMRCQKFTCRIFKAY